MNLKYITPKNDYLSNIRLGRIKEMSLRDVSFTNPKHILL